MKMPLSLINTLYNMKMFLVLKKRKKEREMKSKSVTTLTFAALLARYADFEIYNDILHFGHQLTICISL